MISLIRRTLSLVGSFLGDPPPLQESLNLRMPKTTSSLTYPPQDVTITHDILFSAQENL